MNQNKNACGNVNKKTLENMELCENECSTAVVNYAHCCKTQFTNPFVLRRDM